MKWLESQAGVSASWVNARIDEKLAPTLTDLNNLTSFVHDTLKPFVDLIDADLASLEDYVDNTLYPWILSIDQDLTDLENYVNEYMPPNLEPIELRLNAIEAIWNSEMKDRIDGLDTRIADLQQWVNTSLANLIDYVDIELKIISDSLETLINATIPSIVASIDVIQTQVTNALLSISEQFTLTTIERRAWDRFPEVVAAKWLGIYRSAFPEYKNILKLWLARILE